MEEGVQIGNLQIPIAKGEKGNAGTIQSISITMLSTTATPYANNTGTPQNAVIELGIPRGVGISSATINQDGELVFTLTDETELNIGVIMPNSISNVSIDENYDFIVTLTDGTEITAGNIETTLEDILDNYYDKDTADSTFALIDEAGNKVDLSINSTTYVMTLNLKDKNDNILSTDTIDLPLESVVVSGSYDSVNKKVVLTLQSGSTIEFSVADLISGLQSEITSSNKLSADLVSDTSTTNKFVTSAQKTIIDSVKTNYAHTLTLGYTASTQELAIGIADYNGTVLDTGIADLTDLARKSYVDDLVGDINTMLDQMNREVV